MKCDNLVLGPGSSKGFMFLGFLVPLHDHGVLSGIQRYVGVSVGAVICLLVIIGWNPRELIDRIWDIDILDVRVNITDTVRSGGLQSMDKMRVLLTTLILERFSMVPTLSQLRDLTGKDLTVVVSCVTDDAPEYMSASTHPHLNVVEAVIMSSNIPGLFHEYEYLGKYYCDGIFSNPYPIDVVDDGKSDTIGVYVKSISVVNNRKSRFMKIAYLPLDMLRERALSRSSPRCTNIRLEYSGKEGFRLTENAKIKMVSIGYAAAYELI